MMNLDIAICPGCGQTYTLGERAAILERDQGFACDCGMEWNGEPFFPLTIREMCEGEDAGTFRDVDLSAYTSAVVKVLTG